ncbi:MAG: putative 4-hydroxybenzoate polyprenyltransferase [Desulfobacteraceae bacterium]|nr:putative 4-hydroxybenzoate polyprenyltransferase [Desulfobacteraceae bacterium]
MATLRMVLPPQLQTYLRLIKFSHTIFALPFALGAIVLASRRHPVGLGTFVLILVAIAAARSAAMGFNRFADRDYDEKNPRTANRPHVTGEVKRPSVLLFILLSSGVFVLAAALLGPLCFVLSFPVLAVLFFYSYTKRFTSLCHLVLGFGIGLAPVGAWVAISGGLDPRILLLSCALMTYIAGFDILYACQDIDFDRKESLFSMPARWGAGKALALSTALHAGTFACLLAVYHAFDLGRIYLFFLALIGLLLLAEHRMVRPECFDNVNIAFFHVNSAISVLLFLGIFAGTVWPV